MLFHDICNIVCSIWVNKVRRTILNLWEVGQSSNTILVFFIILIKVKEIKFMEHKELWQAEWRSFVIMVIAHMQNIFFHPNAQVSVVFI